MRPAAWALRRQFDRLGRIVVEGDDQQRVVGVHRRQLLGAHRAEIVEQEGALADARQAVIGVAADAEGAARRGDMHGLRLLQRVDEGRQRRAGDVLAQAQQRVEGRLDEGLRDLVRIDRGSREPAAGATCRFTACSRSA